MSQYNKRLQGRAREDHAPGKPGTLSLLSHIFRATVSDGMQWPLLLCVVLVAAAYRFNFAHHESLTIAVVTGVLVTGLLRGCSAWQQALNDYQQLLAIDRHRRLEERNRNPVPGGFPDRQY